MEIRIGDAFCRVGVEQYRTWMVAMEALDRSELVAACARHGVASPQDNVSILLEEGLLIELADEPIENRELLGKHRMLPIGLGLGNSAKAPEEFLISPFVPGSEITVDVRVYVVWALSTQPLSIADAAIRLAREHETDPEPILAQIALNLPLLMRSGAALLDLV